MKNSLSSTLPDEGFVRTKQILGDKKADPPIPAVIPVSNSTWWAGVKKGRFPKPKKISENITVWDVKDIRKLINDIKTIAILLMYILFLFI